MKKILITGALGNVGGYLAKWAINNQLSIRLADINKKNLEDRYGTDVDTIRFDFLDPTTFRPALDGVDRIFLMRPPHLGQPSDLEPFIKAIASSEDIVLVSFLSLIGIENNPIPPHYRLEKMIERYGIPYCHVRPSFYMQNISGIHAFEIKHFNQIIIPASNALTSFIDADDIGRFICHIFKEPLKHQNKAYSITGPEAIGYKTVANLMSEELDRPIYYDKPSPALAKKYWINIRGLDRKYATVMGLLYMMTRYNTAKKVTSTYKDITSHEPTGINEFIRKNRTAWL